MSAPSDACQVAVVGGGPVGLTLGCLLAQRGVEVRVFEARRERALHSRAIGVHPPGLSCLRQVGCAEALLARGVEVRRGHAVCFGKEAGAISFDSLPAPFDFVLSVPQRETELLLEAQLRALAPDALRHQAVEHVAARADFCLVYAAGGPPTRAQFVVGCDGKHSLVRRAMAVGYPGGRYPHSFLMADAPDGTRFGNDAFVFFTEQGLVECFPLPGGRRRWVVGTSRGRLEPAAHEVCARIEQRTGVRVPPASVEWVSAFTAEHYCAERFSVGRLALAGDAAHVLSPIGGQGMNLGLLDARALADALQACLRGQAEHTVQLTRYGRKRRRAARQATLRAELFMALGCSIGFATARTWLLRTLLERPFSGAAARVFTMHGLA